MNYIYKVTYPTLVIFGNVGVVCKLEWVKGVWDENVDVCHDQPFKALQNYRCECLRDDSHLGRLSRSSWEQWQWWSAWNMLGLWTGPRRDCKDTVKTLASWSVYALRMRPGIQSSSAALTLGWLECWTSNPKGCKFKSRADQVQICFTVPRPSLKIRICS
jgi:hypothetical protein